MPCEVQRKSQLSSTQQITVEESADADPRSLTDVCSCSFCLNLRRSFRALCNGSQSEQLALSSAPTSPLVPHSDGARSPRRRCTSTSSSFRTHARRRRNFTNAPSDLRRIRSPQHHAFHASANQVGNPRRYGSPFRLRGSRRVRGRSVFSETTRPDFRLPAACRFSAFSSHSPPRETGVPPACR